MSTPSNTQTNPGSLKVGRGPVAAAAFALGILGTVFAANFVGRENTVGLLTQERAAVVASNTGSRLGTGATVATVYLPSPFDSLASKRGFRSGSGVVYYAQLDVKANPTGAVFDCHRTTGAASGTGGSTAVFTNVSATGSISVSQTALTLGPAEGIACHTLGRITSATSLRLRALFSDSDVTN